MAASAAAAAAAAVLGSCSPSPSPPAHQPSLAFFLPSLRPPYRQCRPPAKRSGLAPTRTWQASMSGASSLPSSQYAKEMERIAAKEALLLAIKDAGGVDALTGAKATDIGRIDVNERIISLERLNPTPRPTTSPLLEGLWQFKWVGANSPGLLATRVLLQRFPSAIATLEEVNLLILDGCAKATASLKIFNTIGSSVILTSKLTVEGPLRLKEEYMEGVLATPTIQEGTVPAQVQNVYEQFLAAMERLPDSVKETISNGVKIPLTGTFERQLLISYLDDEILVVRDASGAAEVLFRISGNATVVAEPVSEYVS